MVGARARLKVLRPRRQRSAALRGPCLHCIGINGLDIPQSKADQSRGQGKRNVRNLGRASERGNLEEQSGAAGGEISPLLVLLVLVAKIKRRIGGVNSRTHTRTHTHSCVLLSRTKDDGCVIFDNLSSPEERKMNRFCVEGRHKEDGAAATHFSHGFGRAAWRTGPTNFRRFLFHLKPFRTKLGQVSLLWLTATLPSPPATPDATQYAGDARLLKALLQGLSSID